MTAKCCRPACTRVAEATLLYDYATSTVTVVSLAEPHPMQYDLCGMHAARLSVPRGWTLVDRRLGVVHDVHASIAS